MNYNRRLVKVETRNLDGVLYDLTWVPAPWGFLLVDIQRHVEKRQGE